MTAEAPELGHSGRKTNIAMIVVTVLPFIGLLLAVTMSWNEAVGPTDPRGGRPRYAPSSGARRIGP